MAIKKATVRDGNLKTRVVTVEEVCDIPEALAAATMAVLNAHAANGDLGWVEDMVAEVQRKNP